MLFRLDQECFITELLFKKSTPFLGCINLDFTWEPDNNLPSILYIN